MALFFDLEILVKVLHASYYHVYFSTDINGIDLKVNKDVKGHQNST